VPPPIFGVEEEERRGHNFNLDLTAFALTRRVSRAAGALAGP
jgi:hypothetical protein